MRFSFPFYEMQIKEVFMLRQVGGMTAMRQKAGFG